MSSGFSTDEVPNFFFRSTPLRVRENEQGNDEVSEKELAVENLSLIHI